VRVLEALVWVWTAFQVAVLLALLVNWAFDPGSVEGVLPAFSCRA
jgi:hypothetical protein